MNTNEFNKLLDKMLISQTKKIIKEQVEETNLVNKVKRFSNIEWVVR
jgi:hypothetical protein